MYGMPFASHIAPIGQISTTPFYSAPQPMVSSYFPGAVSYTIPYGAQPLMGVSGNTFIPSITTTSHNSIIYTQTAKQVNSQTQFVTSSENSSSGKVIDVRIEHSKENVNSNSAAEKPSEEIVIR